MNKHTPGPWTASIDSVFGPDEKLICDVGIGCTRNQDVVDARLIAAAPDLLAACEKSLKFVRYCKGLSGLNWKDDCELEAIEKAIAKAYGE